MNHKLFLVLLIICVIVSFSCLMLSSGRYPDFISEELGELNDTLLVNDGTKYRIDNDSLTQYINAVSDQRLLNGFIDISLLLSFVALGMCLLVTLHKPLYEASGWKVILFMMCFITFADNVFLIT